MKTAAAALALGALALGVSSPTDTAASRAKASKPPATVLALRPIERRGIGLVRLDRRSEFGSSTR